MQRLSRIKEEKIAGLPTISGSRLRTRRLRLSESYCLMENLRSEREVNLQGSAEALLRTRNYHQTLTATGCSSSLHQVRMDQMPKLPMLHRNSNTWTGKG